MSTGNPELWTGAIEVLVPNATILMEAIAEVLNATEVATITRSKHHDVPTCKHDRSSPICLSLYRRLKSIISQTTLIL